MKFLSQWDVPLLQHFVHIGVEAKETGDQVAQHVYDIFKFIVAFGDMEYPGGIDAVLERFAREVE